MKKIFLHTVATIAIMFAGSSVALAATAPATNGTVSPVKAPAVLVGKSKFVIEGTIVSASATTVNVAITSTSKNMVALKKTTQSIPITAATKLTQQGKKVEPSKLSAGMKVKVFGVYDKKTSKFVKVRWIKVL